METREISVFTMELAKIIVEVNNAKVRAEVVTKEKTVTGSSKQWMKSCVINRLNGILNDVLALFPPGTSVEDMEQFKTEFVSDEASLQLQEMHNTLVASGKVMRDDVEKYIYLVWAKNREVRDDCEAFALKRFPNDTGCCQTDGHYLCGVCKHICPPEHMELGDNLEKYYPRYKEEK